MWPFAVVPNLNILKYDARNLLFVGELVLVDTFSFKRLKEALSYFVAPAIVFSAPASDYQWFFSSNHRNSLQAY
jgi:hypothetical protein